MAARKKDPVPPAPKLSPFDGKSVLNATIAIRNAGDGLSQAMTVDPQEFHHGDLVFVVLACEVEKVRFDPIKDTDALTRVHMFKAGTATIVDEELVSEHLDKQRQRIEAAAGIQRLPFGEPDGGQDPDADPLHVFDGERPEGMTDEEWEASANGED